MVPSLRNLSLENVRPQL